MKWIRVVIAAAAFTAFCAAVYFGATHPVFRVQDVHVVLEGSDPSFIFPAIKESLDKKLLYLRGEYVWRVDIENVLSLVERDRRVKDVKVTRRLPNALFVSIAPHMAVANILGNKSDVLYPVARDGSVLPPVEASEAPDSPILRGESFLKDHPQRSRVLNVLENLPEDGNFSRNAISEVFFDKNKDLILILKKGGTRVILGQGERAAKDVKTRVGQVSRVLNYLENQRMVGRVIDARYSKKVVVKLRNEP